MKVVLLNGPPRAGKDTAANAILSEIRGSVLLRMSGALKRGTHALFGLHSVDETQFEDTKDTPMPEFQGMTPRQAYIHISEAAVKPAFGNLFFGNVLTASIERAEKLGARMAVIPDSGFASEAQPVIDRFGSQNVLLIRVSAPGRGCTFANDSRSHIELPGVLTLDFTNDDNRDDFCHSVVQTVRGWAWVGPRKANDYIAQGKGSHT